jgi:integrase
VAELGQIVSSIDADTAIGKRDRAIFLVGYASAMRPGEVSDLDVEDILRKPTGFSSASADPRRTKTLGASWWGSPGRP